MIGDKPLIAYTINAALGANLIDRVIVSTDDPEIATISKEYGAEIPFLRPSYLADDTAPMLDVMVHALDWFEKNEDEVDILVLLQPTSPLRTSEHIDEAIKLFVYNDASSVVSVVEVPHQYNPASIMKMSNGYLYPFLGNNNTIMRRQDKPRIYARNGPAILVCAPDTLRSGELYGNRCVPYVMRQHDSLDIDEPEDLVALKEAISKTVD